MPALALILCLLFTQGEVLVLKNGKRMPCDSYHHEDGRVSFIRQGQRYTLPDTMIDWKKTRQAKATARPDQNEPAARQSTNLSEYYADAKPKNKVVNLTNESIAKSTPTRGTTISYRTSGNNILVEAIINGRGPYDFILDTGAAMTVLSPKLAGMLKLPHGRDIMVHGVGGAVPGKTALVESLSVNEARVTNLPVVVREIPALTQIDVVGLLGQDYLNHFVMSLDSARKMVTLTPHGNGQAGGDASPRQAIETFRSTMKELEKMSHSVGNLSRAYVRNSRLPEGAHQKLSNYMTRLPTLNASIIDARQAFADQAREKTDEVQNRYDRYSRCTVYCEQLANALSDQVRTLRALGMSKQADASKRIRDGWQDVVERADAIRECAKE